MDAAQKPMRIFEMNDFIEWWADVGTPEEVLERYMEYTGCSHEQSTGHESEFPRELTDAEMDSLIFNETNDQDETIEQMSFREKLNRMIEAGEAFPCPFAASGD